MGFSKNHYHRLPLVFIALLAFFLISACDNDPENTSESPRASATPEFPQAQVTVAQASVFTSPDRNSPILINLFQGDIRRVLQKSSPDALGTVFYELDLGNQTGWVLETQIQLGGDLTQIALLPSPTPTLGISTPTIAPLDLDDRIFGFIVVSRAIVLETWDRDSEELGALLEGETFEILAQTPPDETGTVFYGVRYNDRLGWLLSSQVQVIGDIQRVALLVSETPTPSPSPTAGTPAPTLTETATFTVTAFPLITEQASPTSMTESTPLESLPTPLPTELMPTPSLAFLTSTPEPTPILLSIREGIPPPLTLELPEGWEQIHVVVPTELVYGIVELPLAVYQGPLPDGLSGTLWIVWGFPNLLPVAGEETLWSDGLLYLRSFLFRTCVMGIDMENRQSFKVGDREGIGTYYSAVQCGEVTDITGWFAALQVDGGNYAFYVGVEPVGRIQDGLPPMQTILDSVRFLPPVETPPTMTPSPEN